MSHQSYLETLCDPTLTAEEAGIDDLLRRLAARPPTPNPSPRRVTVKPQKPQPAEAAPCAAA